MVEGVGFEPTYAMRADLQSAAFNHSATPPSEIAPTDGGRDYEKLPDHVNRKWGTSPASLKGLSTIMANRPQPSKKPAANAKSKRPHARPESDNAPYWLYGMHPVRAALHNPARRIHRIVATRNAAHTLNAATPVDIELADRRALDKLVPADAVHQGIAALIDPLPNPPLHDLLKDPAVTRLVVLDQVTDPHNVGAIFRSAAAFNAHGIVTTRRHAPGETAVLVKAAAGMFELLPYIRVQNLATALETLKDGGVTLIGMDSHAETGIEAVDKDGPIALILGSEGKGLRQRTKELCDHLVRLEINPQVESLNVSNAAAVALYALTRD